MWYAPTDFTKRNKTIVKITKVTTAYDHGKPCISINDCVAYKFETEEERETIFEHIIAHLADNNMVLYCTAIIPMERFKCIVKNINSEA